jgi:hypothetical protein
MQLITKLVVTGIDKVAMTTRDVVVSSHIQFTVTVRAAFPGVRQGQTQAMLKSRLHLIRAECQIQRTFARKRGKPRRRTSSKTGLKPQPINQTAAVEKRGRTELVQLRRQSALLGGICQQGIHIITAQCTMSPITKYVHSGAQMRRNNRGQSANVRRDKRSGTVLCDRPQTQATP